MSTPLRPVTRIAYALDSLNFFLADVRGALGPYVGVYLLTVRHWDQSQIGFLMTISGLTAIAMQTPAGLFIDVTRAKRAALLAGVFAIGAAAFSIPRVQGFLPVFGAQVISDVAGAFLPPAVIALTLGLTPTEGLPKRLGRNAALDHAGNVCIALAAAAVGSLWSQASVFLLAPLCAAFAAAAVLTIPASAIDHQRARGSATGHKTDSKAGLTQLLSNRSLTTFALCVALFHFANAAMLPLVGQKLALAHPGVESALLSSCIIIAQLIMLPMAMLTGARAQAWGRKPLFLSAFAILPLRGVLYTLSDDAYWLLGIQLLDGVGAGILSVLTPLILADIMEGTGRYNLVQGAVATAQGIGAVISNALAGLVVVHAGYSTAFLALATVAAIGGVIFWLVMPETSAAAAAKVPSLAV